MSAHKPRRRKEHETVKQSSAGHVSQASNDLASTPFTLADLLATGQRTSQTVLLTVLLSTAIIFRWSVGLWGYSGQGITPMHGDFEAQRHWMEITAHLPSAKWYFYDLQYWGLDYPPMTAYHSYLLGKLGSFINPQWFALDKSRGYESDSLKLYMRASVVGSELLFYFPSAIAVCRRLAGIRGFSKWEATVALAALLMQPGNLLVDHGHFQYNTVMLGLVLGAINAWTGDQYALGCALFVASLAFKQMALYYAPAVFAYLLGSCVFPRINLTRFLSIAMSTLTAFGLIWLPLILSAWYWHVRNPELTKSFEPPYLFTTLVDFLPVSIDVSSPFYVPLLHITQSIHRIFPLARGLFEDKVANLWLAIHTLYKLHGLPVALLSRASLLATLGAVFPSSLVIFLRPRKSLLPLALACSAWSFFLLSFQVHEKSVLLPLLPMTLLLASEPNGLGPETRAWVAWANTLGSWTIYPLLKRDGQAIPYAVITLLWTVLMDVPPLRWEIYRIDKTTPRQASEVALAVHSAFYIIMALWHWCEVYVGPPARKPDLWVVLNCLVGVVGFVICWLWCNVMLLYRSGLLDRWFGESLVMEDQNNAQMSARHANGATKKTAGAPGTSRKPT